MRSALAKITEFIYKAILKPAFFLIDPEKVHDRATSFGNRLGKSAFTRNITKTLFFYEHPFLEQEIVGIKFKNPVGLAAGFDKNGLLTDILPCVGFGHEEIGSVTGEPCEGNKKPRLWRLPKFKSLAVNYGLMNAGCEAIADRLKEKKFKIPIGISIAKTNSPDTIECATGVEDYFKAYRKFYDFGIGDYYAVNISCPNAFGGEPFNDPIKLDRLLKRILSLPKKQPIFIKLGADMTHEQVDVILEVAREYQIDGFIAANLTKNRKDKYTQDSSILDKGGLSGKAVQHLSDELVRYLCHKTKGETVIIGCGGVFSAEDAYKKIRLGACLIQMITGMIYQGPQIIGEINRGLVRLLKRDGFNGIREAVGADVHYG